MRLHQTAALEFDAAQPRTARALADPSAGPMKRGTAMVLQFPVGCIVSVINIMIYALVIVGAVGIARSTGARQTGRSIGTAAALLVAHTLEVFVSALVHPVVGAAPAGSDLLYFVFADYNTTLDYGDVTPVKRRSSLGQLLR